MDHPHSHKEKYTYLRSSPTPRSRCTPNSQIHTKQSDTSLSVYTKFTLDNAILAHDEVRAELKRDFPPECAFEAEVVEGM